MFRIGEYFFSFFFYNRSIFLWIVSNCIAISLLCVYSIFVWLLFLFLLHTMSPILVKVYWKLSHWLFYYNCNPWTFERRPYSAFNRSYSDTLSNKLLFELALLFSTWKFSPSLKMDLLSLLNRRLLSRRLVARFFQLYFQLFRILPIIPFLLPLTTM